MSKQKKIPKAFKSKKLSNSKSIKRTNPKSLKKDNLSKKVKLPAIIADLDGVIVRGHNSP